MDLDQIIARLLSSEATKQELEQLEQWTQESKENAESLKAMKELWDKTENMSNYKDFQKEKAWMKINAQIVQEELTAPVTRIPIIRRLMPLAASLVLLAACVFTFNYLNSDSGSSLEQFSSLETIKDVTLKDHSQLTLDKNSTLTILNDFQDERLMRIDGRSYFQVATDKKRPFVVKTHHGDIKVTGTKFTVDTQPNKTEVFLHEGSVQYDFNGRLIDLKASDAIIIEKGELTKYRFTDQNIESWRSGKLVFSDQRIENVFKSLSRHFDVPIDFSAVSVNVNCPITTTFDNLTLKEILEELKVLFKLDYENNQGKMIIKKLSC